jgi:hypothetical protein
MAFAAMLVNLPAQERSEIFELREVALVSAHEVVMRLKHEVGRIAFIQRLAQLSEVRIRQPLKYRAGRWFIPGILFVRPI